MKEEKGNSPFFAFCSLLRFPMGWLIPAHIGEGRSYLLSLLNQMLIFQKHLKNTLRHNVLPAVWASLKLVKLTHKIYHHTSLSFSKGSFVEQAGLFVLFSMVWLLLPVLLWYNFICPTTLCINSCPLCYPVFPVSSSYLPCSCGTQGHSKCGWQLTGFSWNLSFLP